MKTIFGRLERGGHMCPPPPRTIRGIKWPGPDRVKDKNAMHTTVILHPDNQQLRENYKK